MLRSVFLYKSTNLNDNSAQVNLSVSFHSSFIFCTRALINYFNMAWYFSTRLKLKLSNFYYCYYFYFDFDFLK